LALDDTFEFDKPGLDTLSSYAMPLGTSLNRPATLIFYHPRLDLHWSSLAMMDATPS